jgi:hypothetical protein
MKFFVKFVLKFSKVVSVWGSGGSRTVKKSVKMCPGIETFFG